jgi:hypothetical protein
MFIPHFIQQQQKLKCNPNIETIFINIFLFIDYVELCIHF